MPAETESDHGDEDCAQAGQSDGYDQDHPCEQPQPHCGPPTEKGWLRRRGDSHGLNSNDGR